LTSFGGLICYYYLPAYVGGFQLYGKMKSNPDDLYETFIFATKSDAWVAVLKKGNPRNRF
jgi:hypothetical protein